MTRLANKPERTYRSELRAEQAEETRERILEATVRVMADGVASVSIPAVAREAGVSVPTVYRHFGTKGDLLAQLYPHFTRKAGLVELVTPHSAEEFGEMVRFLWARLETMGDLARLAVASPAGEEVRHLQMPDRLAKSRQFVAEVAPGASEVDRERMARVLVILLTSSALRTWRDHFGLSVDEAADDLDWVLQALIASATERSG
jgi:AcrR family transcriptional regulator